MKNVHTSTHRAETLRNLRQTSRLFCSEATQYLFYGIDATCGSPSSQPHVSKLTALERLQELANSEFAVHINYLRFGLLGTGVTCEVLDNYLRDIQHILPAVAPMLTNLDTLVLVTAKTTFLNRLILPSRKTRRSTVQRRNCLRPCTAPWRWPLFRA